MTVTKGTFDQNGHALPIKGDTKLLLETNGLFKSGGGLTFDGGAQRWQDDTGVQNFGDVTINVGT